MPTVIGAYDPLLVRRQDALVSAIGATGYTGSIVLVVGPPPTLRIDPPDAAVQAIIDRHDWTEAGDLTDQRAAAVTHAAVASDPVALSTRSLAAFAATRDNDQAEAFRALLSLLGISLNELAERVAYNRQTTPATPGAPDPMGVVFSATNRLDAAAVLGTIGAYIQAGAGDPVTGGGQ